jgi:hypothetical protein
MAVGPGKYDDLCTYVREQSKATGACVMVFGGEAGWGFSIQAPPFAMLDLAKLLRYMADRCEKDMPKDIVEIIRQQERK